jgi:hypothetical protein
MVGRPVEHTAAGRREIAFAVIAHKDVPAPARQVREQEPVDRPFKRRRPAMNRIARQPLEGIEGGITLNRVPQPIARVLPIGVICSLASSRHE